MSPLLTVFDPAVKFPALNNVPVVLSIVDEPEALMNAPYTVPELVMLNTTDALVANTAGLAVVVVVKLGVLRVPE